MKANNWTEYRAGRFVRADSVNHIFIDDQGRVRFDSTTAAKGIVDNELEAVFLRALGLMKANGKLKVMKWQTT